MRVGLCVRLSLRPCAGRCARRSASRAKAPGTSPGASFLSPLSLAIQRKGAQGRRGRAAPEDWRGDSRRSALRRRQNSRKRCGTRSVLRYDTRSIATRHATSLQTPESPPGQTLGGGRATLGPPLQHRPYQERNGQSPIFSTPSGHALRAVPDLETLRSWWMAALRRGRPKVACPFSPPRLPSLPPFLPISSLYSCPSAYTPCLRIFPSCHLFPLHAYHLCLHSCLSLLYIPAHLPILLACASSLHAAIPPPRLPSLPHSYLSLLYSCVSSFLHLPASHPRSLPIGHPSSRLSPPLKTAQFT